MTTREMPSVYKGKVNTIEDAYSLGFHDGVLYQVDSGKPYSHRNGEIDDPMIDGYYWVLTDDKRLDTIAWWSNKHGWHDPDCLLGFKLEYHIYGPIPMPTRKE